MFSLLLDRLPDNYKGYLIRTDFRVGIQISQALQDQELSEQEQYAIVLALLFGAGAPTDAGTVRDGIAWFMRGGEESTEETDDSPRSFDFDADHARIWSGFRRVYSVDLSMAKLHWFQFLAMLADLDGCAFSDVVGYRLADTSKMAPNAKQAYQKMKKRFALAEVYTPEEQAEVDTFMQQLKGCKD